MRLLSLTRITLLSALLLLHAPVALGQANPHFAQRQTPAMLPQGVARPAVNSLATAQPHLQPPVTDHTRQVLDYYGGASARATLHHMPRRAPIQPQGYQPPRPPVKPFQYLDPDPIISPYLNLDRENPDDDLPSYFTFVLPQMEQIETNRAQQREIRRLRAQVQSLSSGQPQQAPGAPGTGAAAARFMDTAQFYGRR